MPLLDGLKVLNLAMWRPLAQPVPLAVVRTYPPVPGRPSFPAQNNAKQLI